MLVFVEMVLGTSADVLFIIKDVVEAVGEVTREDDLEISLGLEGVADVLV